MGGLSNYSLELTGIAGDPASPVHRLDPRAKLLGLVAIVVVAVSTPLRHWPVYVACLATIAAVALAARVPAREVWRRARIVLPLVVAVALLVPLVRSGGEVYELGPVTLYEAGLVVLGEVFAKATIGALSAVLIAVTTSFPAILRGLEAMRVPRPLVLISAFTYRYLFVIVEEVARMRAALAARGYNPRNALRAAALGRVAAALFLRTYARGERVYLAMLARGYRGEMPRLSPLSFGRLDAAFVGSIVASLVALRVMAEVVG